MTPKSRKILFLIFLLMFLLAAPTIILYSQGYRLNLSNGGGKMLVKTGGLFVKVYPKQSEVYIDGKLAEKTDLFFGSALVENLLPKKYSIEIKKDGYYAWQKSLDVSEKEVTEAKYVTLLPQNPQFDRAAENISRFWPSPDGKKIVFYEDGGDGWKLTLFDVEKNLKSQMVSEDDVYLGGADLLALEWADDSTNINLKAGLKEGEKLYNLSVEKFPPQLKKIDAPPLPANTLAHAKTADAYYYLDSGGFVYKKGVAGGTAAKISQKPITVQEVEYKLWYFGQTLFLKDDKGLYTLDQSASEFTKIFDGVITDLKLSPDGRKLEYFTGSEIWVYFLQDITDEPKKSAGDKLFIVRLSEKITDCYWLNPDYLVFSSGGNIKVAEIDERDKFNIVDLAKFSGGTNLAISWDPNLKNLFVLDNGTLYKSTID